MIDLDQGRSCLWFLKASCVWVWAKKADGRMGIWMHDEIRHTIHSAYTLRPIHNTKKGNPISAGKGNTHNKENNK